MNKLTVLKNEVDGIVEPAYDLDLVYAVAEDGRIFIMQYGFVPPGLSEDITDGYFTSECTSEEPCGVYKGKFVWDACVDYESGVDEGWWAIGGEGGTLYKVEK